MALVLGKTDNENTMSCTHHQRRLWMHGRMSINWIRGMYKVSLTNLRENFFERWWWNPRDVTGSHGIIRMVITMCVIIIAVIASIIVMIQVVINAVATHRFIADTAVAALFVVVVIVVIIILVHATTVMVPLLLSSGVGNYTILSFGCFLPIVLLPVVMKSVKSLL